MDTYMGYEIEDTPAPKIITVEVDAQLADLTRESTYMDA